MSALTIVDGVLEGLQLIQQASSTITQVSTAIQTAQNTGQPVDWTGILGTENTVEAALLSAIAAAKAAGS
jgi:hypothetical protein